MREEEKTSKLHTIMHSTVRYRNNIPNPDGIPNQRRASAKCIVHAPVLLPTISSDDIFIRSVHVEAVARSKFNVTVDYNFIYKQPPNTDILENFELWLSKGRAPEDTFELGETLFRLPSRQRNGTVENELIDIGQLEDVFAVYFQVT